MRRFLIYVHYFFDWAIACLLLLSGIWAVLIGFNNNQFMDVLLGLCALGVVYQIWNVIKKRKLKDLL